MSLREQMLKAGLISQKESRQAAHRKKVDDKATGQKEREREASLKAREVQAQIEAERDEHQRSSQEQQERKEQKEQALREDQRLSSLIDAAYREGVIRSFEGLRRYHFSAGGMVEVLMVNEETGRRLEAGQAAIVVGEKGRSRTLLTAAAARKLREIAPERILTFHGQ